MMASWPRISAAVSAVGAVLLSPGLDHGAREPWASQPEAS